MFIFVAFGESGESDLSHATGRGVGVKGGKTAGKAGMGRMGVECKEGRSAALSSGRAS